MMSYPETMKTALSSLNKNRTRSALTALGIIIGVGAVIAAFAVGSGANRAIDQEIAALGSNFLIVMPDRSARSYTGNVRYLTVSDAEAIEAEVSGVDSVAPMIRTSGQIVRGNVNWTTEINGSTSDYSTVQEQTIAMGRDLTPSDDRNGAKVTILGATVAEKLFEDENPLGQIVRINKVPFTVVGVFEAKGQSAMGQDQDDFALVPLTAAQKRLVRWTTPGRVSIIFIKGVSLQSLNYIQSETTLLLRERHRIGPGDPDDFAVRNISQMLEARRRTTALMSMLLASIAVISLIVGGIGIMNIMLVSVSERTREIGIRLAVGAAPEDIRRQFLTEAVVLSLLGGLGGIVTGIAAGYGFSTFTQAPPVYSAASILLAFAFSAAVGVIFGSYPAFKAAALNPIDALKYE